MSQASRQDIVRCAGRIDVREMGTGDGPRWDRFVESCPQATFFHRAGWKTVIENAFGHRTWFYYAERDGEIAGVLPLAQIRSRLFGHSLRALPFCVYGGIAAVDPAAALALDQAAQDLAARLGVDYLEYRHLERRHPDWPEKPLYATFRKGICADDEANLLAIPRKQRAMVRKGIKAGLSSHDGQDPDRVYEVYSRSLLRLGTPAFPRKYFRLLSDTFRRDCDSLIVEHQGRTIAGVMSFHFRDEVLPYHGGGIDAARDVAGNDFMYWELMRRSALHGTRLFDFGRSKFGTGSFDFKKNWGFEPQPLHYEYQLHRAQSIPDHNPLNPKYRLFIQAWQRLPLWVANAVGPHIVKDLG